MVEDDAPPLQLWVRTEKAQVFGPLAPNSVELLIDNGIIKGRVQISTDGSNYVFPGRMPGVRVFIPRELWGDVVVPGDELDQQWSVMVPPLPMPGAAAPKGSASGPPVVPAAGPPRAAGAPVSAGPGARAQATQRPVNAAQAGRAAAQARPPPPVSAPSSISSQHLFGDEGGPRSRPSGVQPSSPSAVQAPAAPPSSSPSRAVSSAPSRVVASPSAVRPVKPVGELPEAGSLAQFSPLRLYGLCAASEANALISMQLGDRVLQLHFRKGSPEFIDSSHIEDSLPAFLLARGLATPQQIGLAEAQKDRFGGELLPALFGLGLINPSTAFQQLSERATAILFLALTAEVGTFTVQQADLAAHRSMPLGHRWSLYFEQLRRVPAVDIHRRMVEWLDYPVIRTGGLVDEGDLKLLPQEARALTFFDGVRTLSQLSRELPNEHEVLLRVAWMLRALGIVTFGAEAVAEVGAPANIAQATPPPAVPVRSAPPPVQAPVVAPAVAVAPAPVVSAPVLPPPVVAASPAPQAPAAGPARVQAPPGAPGAVPRPPSGVVPGPPPGVAAQRSTVPYPAAPPGAPPRVPGPPPVVAPPVAARPAPAPPPRVTAALAPPPVAPVEGVPQLQALLEKMKSQTFFDLLGVPRGADAGAVKVAYFKLAKSYHPDTIPQGTPEAVAKLKADIFALIGEANRTLSDASARANYVAELDAGGTGEKVDVAALLQAEEFFQKGCILVKARKFPEAVKMLDDAIKANANEGEYYGWRGYAKFFMHPDKAAGHAAALRDIDLSLKMNPAAAAVHYFNGFLWKLMGDAGKAKVCFKRCVELDPRHVDAARELRMAK